MTDRNLWRWVLVLAFLVIAAGAVGSVFATRAYYDTRNAREVADLKAENQRLQDRQQGTDILNELSSSLDHFERCTIVLILASPAQRAWIAADGSLTKLCPPFPTFDLTNPPTSTTTTTTVPPPTTRRPTPTTAPPSTARTTTTHERRCLFGRLPNGNCRPHPKG